MASRMRPSWLVPIHSSTASPSLCGANNVVNEEVKRFTPLRWDKWRESVNKWLILDGHERRLAESAGAGGLTSIMGLLYPECRRGRTNHYNLINAFGFSLIAFLISLLNHPGLFLLLVLLLIGMYLLCTLHIWSLKVSHFSDADVNIFVDITSDDGKQSGRQKNTKQNVT